MDEMTARILDRLDALEARLARLEAKDALVNPPSNPSRPASSPAVPLVQPVAQPKPDAVKIERKQPTPSLAAASLTRPAPAATVPPIPVQKPASVSIEQMIGGRWFLVLGALIVVAGIAFFLKLAYDQGWIGAIPPAVRCLVSAMFGLMLVGVGHVTEKRLGKLAAVGFIASGLGVMFTTAYAAYGFFTLVGPTVAFVLLVAVVTFGVGLAVRAGSLTLAILALAGGYLTPIMLARDDSPEWALPPYLLALLIVGSVLAVCDRKFRPLASIVWWATGLFGTVWVFGVGLPAVGLGFVVLTWLIVHGTRLRLPDREHAKSRLHAAVVSFSTTLWSVGAIWWLAWEYGLAEMWLVPAGGAMATLLGGLALAGMLDGFRQKPETSGEAVGASLLCQAGSLLPVAILVGIDTAWSQISVWLLLGLGACAAGRWMRALSLAIYGTVLLGLGTLRVLIEATGPLHTGTQSVLGLVPTWWMGLMFVAAVAWFVSAWLGRYPVEEKQSARESVLKLLAILQAAVGCILLVLAVLHRDASGEGVLLAYMFYTLIAVGLFLFLQREWLAAASGAFALLATAAWGATFLTEAWYLDRGHAAPFMHPGLLWSLPIVGLWVSVGTAFARGRHANWRSCRFLGWGAGLALMLVATTIEIARVAGTLTNDHTMRAGSVSIWWALVATVLLVAGFLRAAAWMRYVGIGLLLLATSKVLLWDMSQVSPAVRAACFLALGLVLLGVAAQYLKSTRKERS